MIESTHTLYVRPYVLTVAFLRRHNVATVRPCFWYICDYYNIEQASFYFVFTKKPWNKQTGRPMNCTCRPTYLTAVPRMLAGVIVCFPHNLFLAKALSKSWGEFNNASALGRSLYWCQALNIMNKDRYQSTSARRALALLNSPQVYWTSIYTIFTFPFVA